ncbi:MAG: alpha/beta hydrolase [Desulfobacteraceae bacterium]|nr:alpha/beta hydrolase [Desulfobacteraceae bacterium]
MEIKKILVNDYEITYIDCGTGVPLVFVHGSLSDYRSWGTQIKFFSKKYRTIVLSLRHCYPELWNSTDGRFSILQHADDLAVFIKNLNVGPVHIVGHSRGGSIVLKMITDHPHLYRTAVLADPAPFNSMLSMNSEEIDEIEKRNKNVMKALDQINKGDLDKGLEIFTDAVSSFGAWEKLSETTKQIRRDNVWSLKSLVIDAKEPFSCEDAKEITKPILLITGENSPRIYGMMHGKLENSLINYEKTVINNASHGMHRDNPESFNALVYNFLDKNSA